MTEAKCFWFTGLPCSGKTTLALNLIKYFPNAVLLDGDILRNSPLSNNDFSRKGRKEHLSRMAYLAKMYVTSRINVFCCFVSPFIADRSDARKLFTSTEFVEIFVDTPLLECIQRDVKGMYHKALQGELNNFTGITDSYEIPINPEIVITTENRQIEDSVNELLKNPLINPYSGKSCLFIGRWNGIYHNGHDALINKKLAEGKKIVMAIRDVAPDSINKFTAKEVKDMLEYRWNENKKVKVIIIPDIESVEYGRGVGYDLNEIVLDIGMQTISGTDLRNKIKNNDPTWKNCVPSEIVTYIETIMPFSTKSKLLS